MNVSKIRKEVISIAKIVVVIFAFKSTIAANYTVPTGSMIPTIAIGDKLFVNKMAYDIRIPFTTINLYTFEDPKPGDVIVFDAPHDPGTNFVKRLIAGPGDLIEVSNGFVRINGNPLKTSIKDNEQILNLLRNGGLYTEHLGEHTYSVQRTNLPQLGEIRHKLVDNQYFAMGDNRDQSSDSRQWGVVPRENILGKAKFVYFSMDWPTIRWNRIGTKL